ncbi:MAG: hypothetical protein Sv326_1048 [Candidatus Fermentimicrarchaeum limneticum]|jgi:hypothetical protein|uniref:SpoVT-AbrB domain-containing protein n=1 Tax=Fermentimicrarchaeum limneticum TaxID=2795018 RepID=A0A7D6BQY4_FERL1|nr:MAG: hypothetical protein Sv326_1048 [Candidatus Fermentimicrarchaeum limneticum]
MDKEEHFLSKIRRQGSGLHIYFPTEVIKNPNFPLDEKDAVVIKLDPKKKSIIIKKVEWSNLVGETASIE